MIEAFVGLIGGGKSFNAEARMAEYIASGGLVCTNIEQMLDPWYNFRYAEKLKSFVVKYPVDTKNLLLKDGKYWANAKGLKHYLLTKYNWTLQEGQILDINNEQIEGNLQEYLPAGTVEKPVLVVIDEAVDFFDTDDRSTANKDFLTFLRYSRKVNIDLIMIAQEFTELNKRIRNQVQWVWTFKDLGTERVPVLRCRYPVPYRHNIVGAQWQGRRYGNIGEEPVAIKMRWKDQAIFGCYKTEELFREVNVLRGVQTNFKGKGKKTQKDKKMNKYERALLIITFIISLITLLKSRAGIDQDLQESQAQMEQITTKEPKAEVKEKEQERSLPKEYRSAYYISEDPTKSNVVIEGRKYRQGQTHQGRLIARITREGYLYLDGSGSLKTWYLSPRPKPSHHQSS